MALIKSYRGLAPKWGRDCYFSENATIVGDVTMGDECSVWFNAVVRGDVAPITIGNCTNIQDGSCVHVTFDTGPTHIGSYVTIGHNVTVHAKYIKPVRPGQTDNAEHYVAYSKFYLNEE